MLEWQLLFFYSYSNFVVFALFSLGAIGKSLRMFLLFVHLYSAVCVCLFGGTCVGVFACLVGLVFMGFCIIEIDEMNGTNGEEYDDH